MVDAKQTLIAFENDIIGIAYSYCKRSYRFAGHLAKVTSKSTTFTDFLKRYGRGTNKVFINGKQFIVNKESSIMQIPITSLNECHKLKYGHNLDT